jgi:predicted Ser/Thr protein kinase
MIDFDQASCWDYPNNMQVQCANLFI